jgi:outer membrane cobalamin receptor
MGRMWKQSIITGCCAMQLLFAANEDTTKIYKAKDVVVTATRMAIVPEDAPAQVRLVSSETIQRLDGTTAADLLQLVDGVQLMDYGANGGIKKIMFRGLSPENTSLLLNGSPMNDAEYGYLDLNLLPIEAVERLEVSQGGSSALYGGDAAGGVVNIVLRKAARDLHALIRWGFGSFGAQTALLELEGRIDSVGMIAGISREYGRDDFSFLYHRTGKADTILQRSNADYKRTFAYWNGDYQASADIAVTSFVQYVKMERGSPGSLDYPSTDARLNDETFRTGLSATYRIAENFSAALNGSYHHNRETYQEPSSMTDLSYTSMHWMVNGQCEWRPVSRDRMIGGAEYGKNTLDVDGLSWGFPLTMNPVRFQKSVYISNEYVIQNSSGWFDRCALYQTVREDYFSDVVNDAFSPKLGINIRVNTSYDVHVRSSWGKNFRVPTFNDLYYPNFSNSNLNPEHSTAFDVGILGALDRTGRQTLEWTYFDINAKDKIVYTSSGVPYNIGQAENRGMEIRYDYHAADNRFDAYAGFSFVGAKKKDRISETDSTYDKYLAYVPLTSGVFGLSFETEIGRISINEVYTGLRYVDAVNSGFLPASATTDIHLMEKIAVLPYTVTINASVKNVFDTDYQSYAGYPMPGRSFKVSMGIEY